MKKVFAVVISILLVSMLLAQYDIVFIPKLVGIPYFNAMEEGGKKAAKDLGVNFIYSGPTTDNVAEQIQMVDNFITRGVDAIAVAPNDPAAISPVLKKAMQNGILTMTSDTDANADARDIFINQARAKDIGYGMMDTVARILGGKGKFAIVSGGPTAWNLNTWIMYLQERLSEYPDIELVTIRYAGEDVQKAMDVGLSIMQAFPDVKVMVGMNSTSAPGLAQAVKVAGKQGKVFATGITTPNMLKEYMKEGIVPEFILWNPVELGYLTVWTAKYLLDGNSLPENEPFEVPGISTKPIYYPESKELVLGAPLVFTPENIDQFDF
ncbi:MAG TPA: autoinducer 2 ABC transporter substrate-binding protein [Defluviitaleaceae bacterium]|jgi:rhamnose transport system substrate-binding protein|nr:autoinducer 2 ABC transporter substrate-binding protein [Defluviitaleaceae bacterium]